VANFKIAEQLQRCAAKRGFDWPNADDVWHKLEEELAELKSAIAEQNRVHQAEELGDVLFTLVNLARHLNLDSEAALISANNKFKRRFSFIEQSLQQLGERPENCSLNTLETLWQQAKQYEKLNGY